MWCQVNKTSRIFTNFFHCRPDVWCHINTVLICSILITMFFNVICQYWNSFFTRLSLKILPFNLFKVGERYGDKGVLFFPPETKIIMPSGHIPRQHRSKWLPASLRWKTLPVSGFKWWRIIQLKWLKWRLNFNWHVYMLSSVLGSSFRE